MYPLHKTMDITLKLSLLLTLVIYTNSASIEQGKSYKNHGVYEISGEAEAIENVIDVIKYLDMSLIMEHNDESINIIVPHKLKGIFKDVVMKEGLKIKTVFEDFSKIIEAEKPSMGLRTNEFSWSSYHDIDDIYNYLTNISKTYPKWTEIIIGGESYEKRPIMGLRINTPMNNKANTEKPVFFIESGIHAREWIAPATTTYFINKLMTSDDKRLVALRDEFDWRIFPSVNPDGYHYSYNTDRLWRKTRSRSPNGCYGADPNRNWDYNWLKYGASNDPCNYQTYGGSKPFSEVETRSLSAYISNVTNLLVYVGFHSDAQMLLVPYSDSVEHIPNYKDLIQIGNMSLEYGKKVNGETYDGPATAAEILYKASGGSMDWVRHALGTPLVYTYELRGYFFHWPPNQIYQQGDEVTQMMLGLANGAKSLGYY